MCVCMYVHFMLCLLMMSHVRMYICMCIICISISVAPSVTKVIATSLTDMPSDTYNYTLNCTIAPESTADTCEVTLKSGGISKMGM